MEGWGLTCSCGSPALPRPTRLVSLLWPQLVKVLRFSGVPVPAGYENAFQRAMWAFRHCRWEGARWDANSLCTLCMLCLSFCLHSAHSAPLRCVAPPSQGLLPSGAEDGAPDAHSSWGDRRG